MKKATKAGDHGNGATLVQAPRAANIPEPNGNGKSLLIDMTKPYVATITVRGTKDMLMHCWNTQAIEIKSAAKKGSSVKKTDDLESYVLRDDQGRIVMPALNFCAALCHAARDFQDPRSPRKSLRDRAKSIIIPEEPNGIVNNYKSAKNVGVTEWDYEDTRRVVVQTSGISRTRPAFKAGWWITFKLQILAPEYIGSDLLYELVKNAGIFSGLGDFRPQFGQFRIENYSVQTLSMD